MSAPAGPVLVLGLSEAASATAHRLHRVGVRVALAADALPKVHRRRMSFADVFWDGTARLEDLPCRRVDSERLRAGGWPEDAVPFLALGLEAVLALLPWWAVVDARLAKRAEPLRLKGRAPCTIGCGPGHVAGLTCDRAIETQWGDRLGAVILDGPTAALAGEPRTIEGVGRERILYAPRAGRLVVHADIGSPVEAGSILARIDGHPLAAPIGGRLRGMVRDGMVVEVGDKVLEVDPRPPERAVFRGIGPRPRAIAAGVARALGLADPTSADPWIPLRVEP